MTVFPAQTNLYAQWRIDHGIVSVLHDGETAPPERLLQAIWQHQRIHRDHLETLDGRAVRILHPGFINREGGPDFRGAVVQFDNDTPRAGDVEVDIHSAGWHEHGHDRNLNFQNVILHVIWNERRGVKCFLPTLSLQKHLDAPLHDLHLWLGGEPGDALPENLRGLCSAPLRELSAGQLTGLLNQAAWVRFTAKAAQLHARARQVGWEQTLWEGLFRALGYKHNAWPMQCVAETKSRWFAAGSSAEALQARLLGLSGLLPDELTRTQKSADIYLSRAWHHWWRERDQFAECVLPRSLWKFHGLRPANHPQRRLALAAHWLAAGDLPEKLTCWCVPNARQAPAASLLEKLQVRDDFWSWHWTIRSPRLSKPQPLLGVARAADLAVNAILPWLWSRANEGENQGIQRNLQECFFHWPAAEDNAVLKLARRRLLGNMRQNIFKTAAMQQGLIQIVRDFCDHSNAICDHCRFPGLVKSASSLLSLDSQRPLV